MCFDWFLRQWHHEFRYQNVFNEVRRHIRCKEHINQFNIEMFSDFEMLFGITLTHYVTYAVTHVFEYIKSHFSE